MLDSSSTLLNEKNYILQTIKNNIQNVYIIFCNPISGDQNGKKILELATRYTTDNEYKYINFSQIPYQNFGPIITLFFNVIDNNDRNKGILLIKYLQNILQNTYIKILIGGGDGSVMSMIITLQQNNINIKNIIFGHIPLGTGNDLSISLGFGKEVSLKFVTIIELYIILYKYHTSDYGLLDIWKIELILDEINGEMIQKKKDGKKPLLNEKGTILKNYTKPFTNYLSLGYDARVGYNFDPKRTKSRCLNQFVYFWEGLKKNCCRKTATVNSFIDSIIIYEENLNNVNNFNNEINEENLLQKFNTMKIKYILKPKSSINPLEDNKNVIIFFDEDCSFVCQNIISYMGGAKNIWKKASTKSENENDSMKILKTTETIEKILKEPQSMSDKKLEIFTFESGMRFALEKVIGGFAKRFYHGEGPIFIKFKNTKYDENDKFNRLYLNVDGEFYNLRGAKFMIVELDRSFGDGQLAFFMRNKNK